MEPTLSILGATATTPVPWVGLLALVAMFVIPFLPDRLFDGPRTQRHWPRRHICGVCGADWTNGHACELSEQEPALPSGRRLRGELRRLDR
jgi:hypothetical protein